MFRVINESTRKPVDDPALKALRERAVTRLESGALLVTRDKQELPVEHCGAPIVGFDGSLAGAVLIFRDVTERRRTAQRQSMLVGELNHRVKNALAIVQSLVQASLRQATSAPAQGHGADAWPSASRRCIAPTISCSNRNGRARA